MRTAIIALFVVTFGLALAHSLVNIINKGGSMG
jgi:hypothetical protein